jgi:hypothetical protein
MRKIHFLRPNYPPSNLFNAYKLQHLCILKIIQTKYDILEVCLHGDILVIGVDFKQPYFYYICDNIYLVKDSEFLDPISVQNTDIIQSHRINFYYFLKNVIHFVTFWKPDKSKLRDLKLYYYKTLFWHTYHCRYSTIKHIYCSRIYNGYNRREIVSHLKILNNYCIIRISADTPIYNNNIYFLIREIYENIPNWRDYPVII